MFKLLLVFMCFFLVTGCTIDLSTDDKDVKDPVVEKEDICEYLYNSWLKAGIIKEIEVGEDVEAFLDGETDKLPEGTEETTEDEAKALETSSDNAEDAGAGEAYYKEANTPEETKNPTESASGSSELTDEKIGELVYEAKEILEVPEGADLSDEDIEKLKAIGIALKIEGMQTSKKPQTILDKINKYIDEYENVEEEIPLP